MEPKHPAVARFLNYGLFDGLTSFAELEQRISALENTKLEGDAFEVFAEAYLATQKQSQAEEIWPSAVLPEKQKRELNLPPVEEGTDGIYLSKSGEYGAYQAKFRTGRPNLTWRELSTFFGVSDKAAERLVFTNSNSISGTAQQRPGFYAVRGTDLDGLEARDFALILEFLRGQELHYERKTPRPHQDEAIRNIVSELSTHDRATSVMACGTGKTLVALWVAEELGAKRVLVLVPSLSLVQQSLHEWLKETSWDNVSYCCICSDPTVANDPDGIVIHPGDADFPITTNVEEARRWLSRPSAEVSLVFSTDQSSGGVAEAAKGRPPIDHALIDEAP
ncbi:MAG: DEAD/DEAH box helicase family protein, partial [Alphaproteobacteria bacterium]|nr:DEAD/DEAH box helicase family protein [Alphaproteobacteria bacterium]